MSAATSSGLLLHSEECRHLVVKEVAILQARKMRSAASTITSATTLTPYQSGQTFLVTQGAANYNITLPAAVDLVGCSYKFMLGTASANTVSIVAPSTLLYGYMINNTGGTLAATAISGSTSITFTADAVVGDQLTIDALTTTRVMVSALSTAAAAAGFSVA